MCFSEWIWPTNRYDSFRNEFLSQRYDQPFRYDYDNLFGSAIRFYRRMLIETDGRTKVGHPERQGKIPHCGVENARNDHQGSSNGGILPCNHLFSMIMIYISEWPSALFNDILSCIERWCTLRNESTPIYDRFIFARLTACSGCLCSKDDILKWYQLNIKQSAEKNSRLKWVLFTFFVSEWLWPSYRNDGGIFDMIAMTFISIWPQKYDHHL